MNCDCSVRNYELNLAAAAALGLVLSPPSSPDSSTARFFKDVGECQEKKSKTCFPPQKSILCVFQGEGMISLIEDVISQ